MTTKLHKMLVDAIARRMRQKGYIIVAMEGSKIIPDMYYKIPLTINRHRPDLIGLDLSTKKICIGEAKTHDDLSSERTKEQFMDFSRVVGASSGIPCELIIGIPLRSARILNILLEQIVLDKENISIIYIPEELVDDEKENRI